MILWIWVHSWHLMFLLPVPYCASTQAAGGLIVKDFFIGEVAPGLEVGDRKLFAMQNLSSVRLIDFEDSCVVHAKSLLLCPNILFAYGHCLRILATGFEASTKMNSCLDQMIHLQRHQRGDCPQLKPSASGGRAQLKEPPIPIKGFKHQMVVPKRMESLLLLGLACEVDVKSN